jgi:ABC-type nitrate/sulfonate/bicarbonate transport system, ATPase component
MLDSMETAAAPRQSDWKVIQLENLSVGYENGRGNQAEVLRDISLDIYEGEFVCLLGASGCGKSTLLKVVAGLIKPTGGQAMLDGEPITGPDWQRGVVFQQPPLYPWLTVKQNIAFGPRMRRVPREQIRQMTKEYLDKVNLSAFGQHKTYALSGGMRQRVAIARALINEPAHPADG